MFRALILILTFIITNKNTNLNCITKLTHRAYNATHRNVHGLKTKEMNKKIITRFLAVGCVGGGAFLTGVYVERRKIWNFQHDSNQDIIYSKNSVS